MRTYTISTCSKIYTCTEATPQQLIKICEKIGKLNHFQRNKLVTNLELYKNNPGNITVKNKLLSVILENFTRKQLLKEFNMLTHYVKNDTIICNIIETKDNKSDSYYISSMRSI